MIPEKLQQQFKDIINTLPSKERGIVIAYVHYARKQERECFAVEISNVIERLRNDDVPKTDKTKEEGQN